MGELPVVVIQENCGTTELKDIYTVVTPSLMSCSMNPGEANQISSIRSENLLCDVRPEAANDKWSPVSGVCLCLLKTLKDLSQSSPLCRDDKSSFQASRWPFVCDDLLIFFSPHLAWLLILRLVAVVLPSSSPGERVGQTAATSKEVRRKKAQRKQADGNREFHFWLE